MGKIPLMNLTRQYQNIKDDINEKVLNVLSSGQYIMGENVKSFEKEFAEYMGVKYAIGVGNGTDALHIALLACNIRPGDEVITCGMSFFATAEAISVVGAKPIFVDCCDDTYVLDHRQIEAKITSKTKAIVVVHLYGQCADMDEICKIAKKYKLKVIEDTAQAAGARYKNKYAGTLGDVGCISFFPTKNIGCAGDGGIILTDDEAIARICKAYRVHGSGYDGKFAYEFLHDVKLANECDFGDNLPKYFNFIIGCNSRLDEIQAAILRVKLPFLESWNSRRREIADYYNENIKNDLIKKPIVGENCEHIYYVYVIMVKERDRFREFLAANDIATGIYFPIPLHLQEVYKNLGYKKGDLPNVEKLADYGVAIPMFPELTELELEHIVEVINKFQ